MFSLSEPHFPHTQVDTSGCLNIFSTICLCQFIRHASVSAHLHFLHIFTFCTFSLSAHLHFLHIFNFCTSSLSAHLHFLHIFTFCTSSISAHLHFLHISPNHFIIKTYFSLVLTACAEGVRAYGAEGDIWA
jgi:hypothetical protein